MSTARGRPNRRLELFSLSSPEPILEGTSVSIKLETGELKDVGKVSSSAYLESTNEARCLAFIKNKVDSSDRFYINELICSVLTPEASQ